MENSTLHLRLDGVRIHGGAAVHGDRDFVQNKIARDRRGDFRDFGNDGAERLDDREAARASDWDSRAPAAECGGGVQNCERARGERVGAGAEESLAEKERIDPGGERGFVDGAFHGEAIDRVAHRAPVAGTGIGEGCTT